MLNDNPVQDVEERWAPIEDFPGYLVSDHGRIRNERTDTYITMTMNSHQLAIVGLMRNKVQCKRSLPLLVAKAFLQPPKSASFDTPINLDGDRSNNHYTNLEWRPIWFARKYRMQMAKGYISYNGEIEDVETHIVYENTMHAAMVHGLLDSEIYISMLNNTYVWPTNQIFRKVV